MMGSLMNELFTSQLNLYSVLGLILLLLFLSWWAKQPRNLPPGPRGIPFLGYLPNLALTVYRSGLEPHQIFENIATKYGKIFSMRLAGTLVIVMNEYSYIKEAFQNPLLNDRPKNALHEELNLESGVAFASGQPWKQLRRFTLHTLRDFGAMKRTFEDQITTETKALIQAFVHEQHKPFDPRHLLGNSVSNVICSVVFGKRYEYTDTTFKELLIILNELVKLTGSSGAHDLFPIAKYLQPRTHRLVIENRLKQVEFVRKIIDEHRLVYDPNSDPNDFIDAFLREITNQDEHQESHLNENTLVTTIASLFLAGSETTATTLQWGLLYMIAYPDIQRKIHTEIDDIVGRDRLPRLSDQSTLSYTEATLLEIQRMASITPLGVLHSAAQDTKLNGYDIPQGSYLISNIWAVHHDPEVWEDPFEFTPTRFLDDNGELQHKPELIPFSTGRRVCLGENLAKMELFLFFTQLMHRFTFSKPNDTSKISFDGVGGITNAPKNFQIIVTPR